MVALEAEVMQLGIWKNFDELEESLTFEELLALLEAKRDKDFEDRRFAAALQGVKMPGPKDKRFDEIKERAKHDLEAKRQNSYSLQLNEFGAIAFKDDE